MPDSMGTKKDSEGVLVIAEPGRLKKMFKADQGFCESSLSWLITKFLLEAYFFLQVRLFHFAREKHSMMPGAVHNFMRIL